VAAVSESQVQMIVRVPEAAIDDIDQFAAERAGECTIERKTLSPDQGPGEGELGFDPFTGTVLVWVALKIVGPTAASIATGLVTSAIYDALKRRRGPGQQYEVVLRTVTGESITIRSDKPLDRKELESLITRSVV
jgi:hypothetical protein